MVTSTDLAQSPVTRDKATIPEFGTFAGLLTRSRYLLFVRIRDNAPTDHKLNCQRFFLTVLPRTFHEKAGRCEAVKDILWSGGWTRSHKSEGRACARIKCAAAATKSALSRAGVPSGSSVMSSNPVRIPWPLSSPRRLTAQHAMP